MQDFSASPREMVASFWRNRQLIRSLVEREIIGRYKGSYFGILWSFFNPLLMLIIYTFVFSEVFQTRWNGVGNSKIEFALILFLGLIVFNLFAECINRAPNLILENGNYVKKVVFPLEILPCVVLASALFHCFISFTVWLLAYSSFFGMPHVTILYLPLVITPLLLLIMGLSWALASLGVYLRDVSQFIGLFTTMLMFLSPIFYSATSFPENYRWLLYLNPLTPVIEQVRALAFWGVEPSLILIAIYWVATMLFVFVGFAWFQKTRKGFADVL